MTHYDLRHPISGAEWQDVYEKFPNEVECIKCGQHIKPTYDWKPVILGVNARKKKNRRKDG